jgi:hypothetical protein
MAGDDWQKREACKMAAWIRPKMDHKKMVQRLLQIRAHLILCFRAEEKVDMVRGDDGKMKIVPKVSRTGLDGWMPICEKALPYELTASFLLTADAPGVPKSIKLQEQHRAFFPLDKPIDESAGERLAAWAKGGSHPPLTAALAEAEAEVLNDEMIHAETLPMLQVAFERAWKRAGDAKSHEKRRLFKSTYDACLKKFGAAKETSSA